MNVGWGWGGAACSCRRRPPSPAGPSDPGCAWDRSKQALVRRQERAKAGVGQRPKAAAQAAGLAHQEHLLSHVNERHPPANRDRRHTCAVAVRSSSSSGERTAGGRRAPCAARCTAQPSCPTAAARASATCRPPPWGMPSWQARTAGDVADFCDVRLLVGLVGLGVDVAGEHSDVLVPAHSVELSDERAIAGALVGGQGPARLSRPGRSARRTPAATRAHAPARHSGVQGGQAQRLAGRQAGGRAHHLKMFIRTIDTMHTASGPTAFRNARRLQRGGRGERQQEGGRAGRWVDGCGAAGERRLVLTALLAQPPAAEPAPLLHQPSLTHLPTCTFAPPT